MKIIASFDSPDSADFAAGAVKRAISPLSTISTKERYPSYGNIGLNVFSAYNVVSTTPTYSMPIYTPSEFSLSQDISRQADYLHNDHILEVVCRKEDYPVVSKIIIAHGGRNISKL
ncbi:MAG: hypothetical protein K2N60_09945 [Oscillospiraceae bacterium]|nr:hypothetical protein [Oscillospiraceae bacterium]